jgi:hypothetical protein
VVEKLKFRPILNGSFMDYGAVFERQLWELYERSSTAEQATMREILKGKYDFENPKNPRSSVAKGS